MIKMVEKEKSPRSNPFIVFSVFSVIILLSVVVTWAINLTSDNTDYVFNVVPPTFIARSSEHDLNVTAPMGPTYYTVQLDSNYIYLGEEYYDLHEIPENRVITVTRNDKHSVRICYWVLESDNYYTLVGMGVYE